MCTRANNDHFIDLLNHLLNARKAHLKIDSIVKRIVEAKHNISVENVYYFGPDGKIHIAKEEKN